ncbi:MAG: NAD(P)-dependent oxidoreductase [Deltaproteobacteria bacterium]|nr:NAD(P)-dependent oxidoreductase [Deltaproteobacteria bacterium]
MKRVLVTGGTGFIGRHCLPLLLARGYEVHSVFSKTPEDLMPDVHWHQVDLLESRQTSQLIGEIQPSSLLHLAWYANPKDYRTSPENFRWVQASLVLLQAFVRCGGERVVTAGSCAEYDWQYGFCSEETTPLKPATVYGSCKHLLQTKVASISKRTGLNEAWGRIFFIYGPYEYPNRLVSSAICSLLRGEVFRCIHSNLTRDFLHVEDVASAFVALLESDVQGPVNIGSGVPMALRDIVSKIGEKIGRLDLICFGQVPASSDEPRLLVADVTKLRNEVSWIPRYDVDSSLRETIRWWKENLKVNVCGE